MRLESTFKSSIFSILALVILLNCLAVFSIYMLTDDDSVPVYIVLICAGIFAFFLIWIFFGEFRTKAIKVDLDGDQIIVSRYLGLGIKKILYVTEFDGYKTSRLSSEHQTFEFLYLVAGKRKVVKLSEFYHKNYFELKSALSGRLKYLGNEEFSLVGELREIFT